MTVQDEGSRFPYYGGPYVLSQLTGAYRACRTFSTISTRSRPSRTADDYLSRLNAFASQMDGELEIARHDVAQGATPPDFILDRPHPDAGFPQTRRPKRLRWYYPSFAEPRKRVSAAIIKPRRRAFTRTGCPALGRRSII